MASDELDKPAVGEEVYDSNYFLHACGGADWVERFVASRGVEAYPHYRQLIEQLGMKQGERVLDIGCGRGEVTMMLGMAGAVAVGLDYSQAALGIARQVRDACGMGIQGGVGLVRADATTLPFASESFDSIVMADIVEHLHDWQLSQLYSECWRLLRPGGRLLIHTWPNRWHTELTYPLIARLSRLFGSKRPLNPRKPHDEIVHVNEQSPRSLRQGVEAQAFRVLRQWCDHEAPFSLRPDRLAYWMLHRLPLLRLFFADHLWLLAGKGR